MDSDGSVDYPVGYAHGAEFRGPGRGRRRGDTRKEKRQIYAKALTCPRLGSDNMRVDPHIVFKRVWRGYDPREVDEAFDAMQSEIDELTQRQAIMQEMMIALTMGGQECEQ